MNITDEMMGALGRSVATSEWYARRCSENASYLYAKLMSGTYLHGLTEMQCEAYEAHRIFMRQRDHWLALDRLYRELGGTKRGDLVPRLERPGRPIACSPYGAGVTTRNAVRCLHCDDVIESLHRHDFKRCRCGHVTVDGGPEYKRRLWSGDPSWNEIDHDGNEGVPIVDVVLDREDRR